MIRVWRSKAAHHMACEKHRKSVEGPSVSLSPFNDMLYLSNVFPPGAISSRLEAKHSAHRPSENISGQNSIKRTSNYNRI